MSDHKKLVRRAKAQTELVGLLYAEKRQLWRTNVGLGLLHGITAIVLGALTKTQLDDATVPLYSHLPGKRPDGVGGLWLPVEKLYARVIVGYLAVAFVALAALNHFWVATLGWRTYLKNVKAGRNPVRWFEYAFSASLMHVHVAFLSGSMDAHLNFLIFGLTATTMIFGFLSEPSASGKRPKSWAAFWAGFVPYTFQWMVLFCYFFTAVSRSNPPGFVWAILFVILTLDLSFAVNMYWYLSDRVTFYQAELIYCFLSLTAKQLLAWINFGGTMSL